MKKTISFLILFILIIITLLLVKKFIFVDNVKSSKILVAAAASLKPVLEEIDTLYSEDVDYTFASSGILQQQIEQGAPIDLFISASKNSVTQLMDKNLLILELTTNFLTNKLTLITPQKQSNFLIKSFQDLTNSHVQLIAIGEPKTVPVGQYTIEMLENLNLLSSLESKFIYANDVRATLRYVETGEVDAGIVYITDAKSSNQVKIITIADSNLHSPIIYSIGVNKNTQFLVESKKYLKFLQSEAVKNIFQKYGFGMAE